jgi:hypothetical protein
LSGAIKINSIFQSQHIISQELFSLYHKSFAVSLEAAKRNGDIPLAFKIHRIRMQEEKIGREEVQYFLHFPRSFIRNVEG